MPHKCKVPCCVNQQVRKDRKASFHELPKERNRKLLWCTTLGINPKKASHGNRICSDHFKLDQFENYEKGHLKKTAVPYTTNSAKLLAKDEVADAQDGPNSVSTSAVTPHETEEASLEPEVDDSLFKSEVSSPLIPKIQPDESVRFPQDLDFVSSMRQDPDRDSSSSLMRIGPKEEDIFIEEFEPEDTDTTVVNLEIRDADIAIPIVNLELKDEYISSTKIEPEDPDLSRVKLEPEEIDGSRLDSLFLLFPTEESLLTLNESQFVKMEVDEKPMLQLPPRIEVTTGLDPARFIRRRSLRRKAARLNSHRKPVQPKPTNTEGIKQRHRDPVFRSAFEYSYRGQRYESMFNLSPRQGAQDSELTYNNQLNKCTVCNEFLGSPQVLQSRTNVRNGKSYFKCVACDIEYTTVHTFWDCEICGNRIYGTDAQLTRHAREHNEPDIGPFKCEQCGNGFLTRSLLRNHLTDVHLDMSFKCNICDERLLSEGGLQKHKLDHHHTKKPFTCSSKKPFTCSSCPTTFKYKKAMVKHEQMVHPCVEDEFKLTCDHCSNTFRNQRDLTRHCTVMHDNFKPLRCVACDEKFLTGESLDLHLKSHPKCGRKPVNMCQTCNLVLNKKSDLVEHIQASHIFQFNFR